jgi:acyl-CoA reductase-like NAD-dependent aldehyde dehydrogenase
MDLLSRQKGRGTPFSKVLNRNPETRSLTQIAVPNPLGTVAIISAFNFPVAVYGWWGMAVTYCH